MYNIPDSVFRPYEPLNKNDFNLNISFDLETPSDSNINKPTKRIKSSNKRSDGGKTRKGNQEAREKRKRINDEKKASREFNKTLEAKALKYKLKGVKNNTDRYRITDDFLNDREFRSKNILNHNKPFQPSGANFPDTRGYSSKEIKANQKAQDLNAVNHNTKINGTLGNTFGEDKSASGRVKTSSNFLNSSGYTFSSYTPDSSDKSRAIIRSNNDKLTGAYNKAISDNGVESRYKKALSSSDIKSKLDSYSTTTAGMSSLDRVTERRQQLERANKNRLIRNSDKFNRELLGEKFKETARNSYLNPASSVGKFIKNLSQSLPDYQADSITAALHGIETRETKSSYIDRFSRKIVDTFNPSNNLVTDENKKYVDGALRQYEGYNKITGQGMNIDNLSKMTPNQIEYWKDIQRNITQNSITNRVKGANIDPFDSMIQENSGNYRPNLYTSKSPVYDNEGKFKGFADSPEKSNFEKRIASHRKELSWIDERISSLNNQSSNSIISERGTSNNRYSSFFAATEREQLNRSELEILNSRKSELKNRLDKFDKGYTGAHIDSDFTGPLREGENRPTIHASASPARTFDSFRPVYGNGYGLGFKASMAASGSEHLARFAYFATPFGTGSGRQALMEAAGIMNKSQRMQASQARGFSKLAYAAVPATALGMILMDMHEGKEASGIASDIFSMGTALHGWRVGASLGGATGSLFGKAGKFVGLGLGGVTGLVGGLVAGQALVSGISDAMSNDSQIRSFAKKAGTKEMYANTPETRQTLTARGAALQKLAKSGLNDRGLLLGNEATVLKGGL